MTITTEDRIETARAGVQSQYASKAEQSRVLEDINRAFEAVRSTVMNQLLSTPHEERDADWDKLYWGFPSYPHQWSTKVAQLFHKWGWASQNASELKALREQVKAAQIAPKAAPKGPAVAVPDELRMTCQICGRAIHANTGRIAHHGYQRPGHGYQTASCPGTHHDPFEVSRDELGLYIGSLNHRHDNLVERQRQHSDEEITELTLALADYGLSAVGSSRNRPTIFIKVSAETFAASFEEHKRTFTTHSIRSFEDALARDLRETQTEVKLILLALEALEKRYEGWTQTHRWDGAAFVPA
jgi:hypothetical protein